MIALPGVTIHRKIYESLAVVMKAAQSLSEMIHLDRLIATLMQVALKNAGAETGALVLLEDDRLTVVAQCSGSRQCDLEKIALVECATIPISAIHSVERTQETLVLDDAVSEPSFLTDPYIQNQQTRSLLCMPILKQSEAKFRTIFENSRVGIFRTRLSDGLLLDANQRHANLFGFDSPEESIGLEHATDYYVNPSDRQQFLELLKRDREVRSYEWFIRHERTGRAHRRTTHD
jgi:PAS domain S-box-containing protein